MPNSHLLEPPHSSDDLEEDLRHSLSPDQVHAIAVANEQSPGKNYKHYFKDVSHLDTIDVYRILDLYEVTDHAIGHAIKKLLVAGGRNVGKSQEIDIQEAIDALTRRQHMQAENLRHHKNNA